MMTRKQTIRDPRHRGVTDIAQRAGYERFGFRPVLQQTFDPFENLVNIGRAVENDHLNAGINLRENQCDQSADNGHHDDLCHGDGEPSGFEHAKQTGVFPGVHAPQKRIENLFFIPVDGRCQNICDDRAPDERTQDPDDPAENTDHRTHVVKEHVKHNSTGNHDERRDSPADVFIIHVKKLFHESHLQIRFFF